MGDGVLKLRSRVNMEHLRWVGEGRDSSATFSLNIFKKSGLSSSVIVFMAKCCLIIWLFSLKISHP